MKNYKIFVIGVLVISLIVGLSMLYRSQNMIAEQTKSKVMINSLVANKTWQTKLQQNVVYKKGDNIEYNLIIRNNDDVTKKINIRQLVLDSLGLENIKVDKTSDEVLPGQATIIKISGEATYDGSSADISNLAELIDDAGADKQNIENNTSTIEMPEVSFEKNEFVGGTENLIKVHGTGLDNIKSIGIGDKIFALVKTKENQYYIDVSANNFSSGEYFVFVVGIDGKVKALNKTFKFVGEINKEVTLTDLLPKEIYNDSARWIVLQGSGFKNTISVQLSNNIIFQNTEFKIISDQVLAVKIPEKLEAGEYYLNVMTLKGIYNLSSTKFNILQKQ